MEEKPSPVVVASAEEIPVPRPVAPREPRKAVGTKKRLCIPDAQVPDFVHGCKDQACSCEDEAEVETQEYREGNCDVDRDDSSKPVGLARLCGSTGQLIDLPGADEPGLKAKPHATQFYAAPMGFERIDDDEVIEWKVTEPRKTASPRTGLYDPEDTDDRRILDDEALEDFLYEILPGVYRLKGIVRTNGQPSWTLVNAVAGRFEMEPAPRVPAAGGALVFIGRDLDRGNDVGVFGSHR